MEKTREKKILEKLNLQKISALFILDNEELCDRILEETPIWTQDFLEKYESSPSTLKTLMNDKIISHFTNQERIETKKKGGRKVFIFEEEAVVYFKSKVYTQTMFRNIDLSLKIFLDYATKGLRGMEKDLVIKVLVEKQSYEEIGEHYGLSRERIRQIFQRGIRRLNRFTRGLKNYDELCVEMNQLKEEKRLIEKFIHHNKEKNNISPDKLMTTRLLDLDLSVRAINCLHAADIYQIGELTIINRKELKNFRNVGVQTIREITELMTKMGLKLD